MQSNHRARTSVSTVVLLTSLWLRNIKTPLSFILINIRAEWFLPPVAEYQPMLWNSSNNRTVTNIPYAQFSILPSVRQWSKLEVNPRMMNLNKTTSNPDPVQGQLTRTEQATEKYRNIQLKIYRNKEISNVLMLIYVRKLWTFWEQSGPTFVYCCV